MVSVMPSQHCRTLFKQMRRTFKPETLIVSATKGLEETTLLRMTEVITQVSRATAPPESAHSAVRLR